MISSSRWVTPKGVQGWNGRVAEKDARTVGWKEWERDLGEVGGTKGPCKSSTSVLPAVAAPDGRACAFSPRRVTFHLERNVCFPWKRRKWLPRPDNTRGKPRLGLRRPLRKGAARYLRGKHELLLEVDALTNIHSNFTAAWKTGAALQPWGENLAAGVHLLIPWSEHNEPWSAVAVNCAEKAIIINTQTSKQFSSYISRGT